MKFISENAFLRNVSILVGGTAISQILIIGASPIITRLYIPEDFGTLALFSAFLAVLGTSSSLRYHLAIPLPDNDDDALQLLALSLSINLFFSIVTVLFVCLSKPLFSASQNLSVVQPYIWILPISTLAFGFYESLKFWAIRKKQFKKIAKTKFSQNAGLVMTQITMGYLNLNPLGLLLGDAIGRSGGTCTLFMSVYRDIGYLYREVSIQKMKIQAIRYKKYPLYGSSSGVINSLGMQVVPILMVLILGPVVAGFYALTQRVISIPMSLIGLSYSHVYYKEASVTVHESTESLKRLFVGQTRILFLLGLFVSGLFTIIGQTGFALVFGEEWRTSGLYAQILAPIILFQFIVVPLSQTLNILNKQNIQLLWDISRLILIFVCFIAIKVFSIQATLSLTLLSAVISISYIILYFITYRNVSQKNLKY
jgi:O-antigen/teichoic acid export membrane protein